MLVISAGMIKSGSGWLFNQVNDILIEAGYENIRDIKEKYNLNNLLEHYNCNINQITVEKLNMLTSPPFDKFSFCIKTHSGPIDEINYFIKKNKLKIIYIHRDPRDVVLSLLDHGKKIREEGNSHSFASIDSIEKAVSLVENVMIIKKEWEKIEGIQIFKYEALSKNPKQELERLCDYLGVQISDSKLTKIIESNSFDNIIKSDKRGFHYNKGIRNRYKTEMDTKIKEYCDRRFKKLL